MCFQAEFGLGDIGPALRYRTTTGMALTPIRMASLNEDGEDPQMHMMRRVLGST